MRDTLPDVDHAVAPEVCTESLRMMSNILDLASSAGNAAEAIRSAGVRECRAMRQADAFVTAVKDLPKFIRGGYGRFAFKPALTSLEQWKAHHAQAMEIARHLQSEMWKIPEAGRGETFDHLARLLGRIEDGERLAA